MIAHARYRPVPRTILAGLPSLPDFNGSPIVVINIKGFTAFAHSNFEFPK